jgi:hypothetical protein
VVLEAQGESRAAHDALENLCRTYWRPIYSFVRREGVRPEEAKDLTQGFFALILERKDFQSVRQEKGRLRSFLRRLVAPHFISASGRDLCPFTLFYSLPADFAFAFTPPGNPGGSRLIVGDPANGDSILAFFLGINSGSCANGDDRHVDPWTYRRNRPVRFC